MKSIRTLPEVDRGRRSFLADSAAAVISANLGLVGSAVAQSNQVMTRAGPGASHASFTSLKQIDAGLLNVGYAEAGATDGRPVILLHGWRYDIYSFVDVAPLLASRGYRVIVPYLRGFGTTSFLSSETMRNGQQSAVALDVDAL